MFAAVQAARLFAIHALGKFECRLKEQVPVSEGCRCISRALQLRWSNITVHLHCPQYSLQLFAAMLYHSIQNRCALKETREDLFPLV